MVLSLSQAQPVCACRFCSALCCCCSLTLFTCRWALWLPFADLPFEGGVRRTLRAVMNPRLPDFLLLPHPSPHTDLQTHSFLLTVLLFSVSCRVFRCVVRLLFVLCACLCVCACGFLCVCDCVCSHLLFLDAVAAVLLVSLLVSPSFVPCSLSVCIEGVAASPPPPLCVHSICVACVLHASVLSSREPSAVVALVRLGVGK